MFIEVEGDILLSKAAVIAHGIAPLDHFDSGLALALRERWPSMVRDYRHDTRSRPLASGALWLWRGVDADGSTRGIVNLLTQDMLHDGRAGKPGKATRENVAHCLKALAKLAHEEQFTSIALPRLATGVGGLDWADVKPLVREHLSELEIPVVVYEVYRKGVAAEENLG